MDRLFANGTEPMIKELMKIEPEMREDSYADTDKCDCDRMSEHALGYIRKVSENMFRYYRQSRRTVLNLIRELIRIASTGEYAYLQDMENLGFEDGAFRHMRGSAGYEEIMYAIRLLMYYYLVREKEQHALCTWKEIEAAYHAFAGMKHLNGHRERKEKKEEPKGIPEEEFLPRLREHMDKYMVGQEVLKKKLCTVLYQWIYHKERTVFLMIGPSGSGKNHVIETIRSFPGLDRTLISYDCSGLTPNGFNGDNIGNIFEKLRRECAKQARGHSEEDYFEPSRHRRVETEGSIIYLDEIDKIINFNHDSHGENVNAAVQQQLLSALAGTETFEGVDTGNILFILGGAFPRMEELEKQKHRSRVGFGFQAEPAIDYTVSLRERIIEIGGEEEFVGRIQEIVKIARLSEDDLRAILMDEKIGAFALKQRIYKASGLNLTIDEEAVDAIVDLIKDDTAGARSVKNIINQFADSQYFYDMKVGHYDTMRIHKGMLQGEPPIFTKGVIGDEKRIRCA